MKMIRNFVLVCMLALVSFVLLWADAAMAAQIGPAPQEMTGGEMHLEHEIEEALEVHEAHPLDGAHGAGHDQAGLPQLDPTWYASQVFWLALTFGVLYIIFSQNILPALSSTIETRREQIGRDLETARKMKEEAERVHKAYEEALDEARHKASGIFAKAEEKMKDKTAKKLATLREKAVQDIEKAEASVAKAKKDALKDMDAIAAEVASSAAKKIVGISADIKTAKTVVANINKKAA